MFCTNCGTEFNGNFCPNCGQAAALSQPSAVQSHDYYDRDGDWIDLSVILGAYRNRAGSSDFLRDAPTTPTKKSNRLPTM